MDVLVRPFVGDQDVVIAPSDAICRLTAMDDDKTEALSSFQAAYVRRLQMTAKNLESTANRP